MRMEFPRVMNTDNGSEFKNVERMKVHYHPQVHLTKNYFVYLVAEH